MDVLPALAGIAAWSGVTALMLRCSSAGADVISPLFGPAAEPGWPHGVQEDDDFRWAWNRRSETQDEDGEGPPPRPRPSWRSAMTADADEPVETKPALPELVELPAGSGAPTARPARLH